MINLAVITRKWVVCDGKRVTRPFSTENAGRNLHLGEIGKRSKQTGGGGARLKMSFIPQGVVFPCRINYWSKDVSCWEEERQQQVLKEEISEKTGTLYLWGGIKKQTNNKNLGRFLQGQMPSHGVRKEKNKKDLIPSSVSSRGPWMKRLGKTQEISPDEIIITSQSLRGGSGRVGYETPTTKKDKTNGTWLLHFEKGI